MNFRIFILAILFSFSLSIHAIEVANIQVSSTGSVEAMPDFIKLEISIEIVDKSKINAKRKADIITQDVLDILSGMEIAKKDFQASQLFIYPEYRWNNQIREHLGDRATRGVSVKLYQLEKYSELADELVATDITRMQQTGFGFDDIEKYKNQAISQALDKAKVKAQVIAEKIDRELYRVYQVSETSNTARPVYRQAGMEMMASAASESSSAPLDIKAQTIAAEIHVIYMIQ